MVTNKWWTLLTETAPFPLDECKTKCSMREFFFFCAFVRRVVRLGAKISLKCRSFYKTAASNGWLQSLCLSRMKTQHARRMCWMSMGTVERTVSCEGTSVNTRSWPRARADFSFWRGGVSYLVTKYEAENTHFKKKGTPNRIEGSL